MNQIIINDEKYDIIKLLGKGGFGHVFEVKCGQNRFALKVETIRENITQAGLLKEKQVCRFFRKRCFTQHFFDYVKSIFLFFFIQDI